MATDGHQLGALRRLPQSIACLAFSYGTGGDYERLWCASRHLWSTLRLEAAGPARLEIKDLVAFLDRRRRETTGGDGGARNTVAAAVLPREMAFPWFESAESLAALGAHVDLAKALRRLTFGAIGNRETRVPLSAFSNLRHLHGSDMPLRVQVGASTAATTKTTVPNFDGSSSGSSNGGGDGGDDGGGNGGGDGGSGGDEIAAAAAATTEFGDDDGGDHGERTVQKLPAGLECVQLASYTGVRGLASFSVCASTLTALGGVTLHCVDDLAVLRQFSALKSLRCMLVAPSVDCPGARPWSIDTSLFAAAVTPSPLRTPSQLPSSLSTAMSPTPVPPLVRLTVRLGTLIGFRVAQLEALGGSLRTLRLESSDFAPSLVGLDRLAQLAHFSLVGDCRQVAFATPPSLASLEVVSYRARLLDHAVKGAFDRVTHLSLVARDHTIALGGDGRFPALTHLRLEAPRGNHTTRWRNGRYVLADHVTQLPRSLVEFEYEGVALGDVTPLADLPRLHTLVYRSLAGWTIHESATKWAPLRALKSLVVRDYWAQVPLLFPALETFRHTNCETMTEDETANRTDAVRRIPSLGEYVAGHVVPRKCRSDICTHVSGLRDLACRCDCATVCCAD
jgi:hypothetical protein